MSDLHRDPRWKAVRRQALDRDGARCRACNRGRADGVRLEVDHIVRIEDGGEPFDLTNLQTLCHVCHGRKKARELARDNRGRAARKRAESAAAKQRHGQVLLFEPTESTSASLSPSLHEPPSSPPPPPRPVRRETRTGAEPAGPPRYFCDPHPRAVGSRVEEWATWTRDTLGTTPRPWQHSAASRLLEVDEEGRWCWGTGFVVSVPRQQGKSVLLRSVCGWLASQGLLVLGTFNRLSTAAEVLRPLGIYVRAGGGRWNQNLGQLAAEWPDGPGRVVFQAATDALAVGWSPDAGVVDEAWDVPEVPVLQGLIPAMSAAPNPFLLLTSTVGTVNSRLLARFRDAALAGSEDVGLVEWGAPPEADWLDEEVWRLSSPEWSPQRLRFMRAQADVLTEAQFRSQLLNQVVVSEDGWIAPREWGDLGGAVPDADLRGGTFAVEVTLDGTRHYGVRAWRDPAGVVHLAFRSFLTFADVDEYVRQARPTTVLAPPVYRGRLSRIDREVSAVDVTRGMPVFAAAVRSRSVRHPEDPRLTEQVLSAQTKVSKGGNQVLVSPDGRSLAGVRAAVWAVDAAHAEPAGRPRVIVRSAS